MKITEEYLNQRIKSLETGLAQVQQQYNHAQQLLNQATANINANQGAIADAKEMLAYLKQEDVAPVALPEKDIMDVTPPEVTQ